MFFVFVFHYDFQYFLLGHSFSYTGLKAPSLGSPAQ